MNRGSPESAQAVAVHPMRFNEAPIHESGKWNQLYDDPAPSTVLQ